jgi:hypothetical protein
LKLPKIVFYLFLCVFVCITNVVVSVEDFIVKELGKLNGRFIQDGLVLVDADNVRNPRFQKDFTYLLRVTTCHEHKLKRGWCGKVR